MTFTSTWRLRGHPKRHPYRRYPGQNSWRYSGRQIYLSSYYSISLEWSENFQQSFIWVLKFDLGYSMLFQPKNSNGPWGQGGRGGNNLSRLPTSLLFLSLSFSLFISCSPYTARHFWSAGYVPNTVLRTSYILSQLMLMPILEESTFISPFYSWGL